ncbi:hypothetical protein D3C80_1041870 [compost metagenome]
MGADDPLDRLAAQRSREGRLPTLARGVGFQARIHQGPAIAVGQGIDIDVVQRHRQRQAQPQHAGRDLDRLTDLRRRPRRIGQAAGGHRHIIAYRAVRQVSLQSQLNRHKRIGTRRSSASAHSRQCCLTAARHAVMDFEIF